MLEIIAEGGPHNLSPKKNRGHEEQMEDTEYMQQQSPEDKSQGEEYESGHQSPQEASPEKRHHPKPQQNPAEAKDSEDVNPQVEVNKELEAYKAKKRELTEKLRLLQEKRKTETHTLLEKVAHINVLSKEYEIMNADLVKTDNEFNSMFKKFTINFGKRCYNQKQLDRVHEVHANMQAGRDVDFAKEMAKELGPPFMKFIRTNFKELKEEEMQFRNITNFIKDKANETLAMQQDYKPQRWNEEEAYENIFNQNES